MSTAKKCQIRKYFHQIPNMADEDLNPYQYRLLGHFIRVCGVDGVCWQSTETIAAITHMSRGKVSQVRRELETMGYIHYGQSNAGTIEVRVMDRWRENEARFSKGNIHQVKADVHTMNPSVHDVKQRKSQSRRKRASKFYWD